MSKKRFFILAIIVFVIVVSVTFAFVLVRSKSATQATNANTASTTFPITGSGSSPITTSGIMTIQGQNGEVIATKNFLDNGVTVKDVENPDTYLVAGSLGYCLPDTACTAGINSEFNITYTSDSNFFTIALLQEPLGSSRYDAEILLQNTLGISSKDLCSLNYYIGTTYTVNEAYASANLGFSNCPGAIKLP